MIAHWLTRACSDASTEMPPSPAFTLVDRLTSEALEEFDGDVLAAPFKREERAEVCGRLSDPLLGKLQGVRALRAA